VSAVLLVSIAIRLLAAAWSVVIYRRVRDWRMLFLTAMLLLMATRQLLTLSTWLRTHVEWELALAGSLTELPGLAVSVLAALAVIFLERMLTEQRLSEKALLERERQLWQSQKLEAVGKLAGGIAHDFNNLLTVVAGNVELARLGLPPGVDEGVRTSLEEIDQAAQRASALTKQVLTFARGQEPQRTVFDLNELIQEYDPMLRSLLGDPVELVTSYQSDLPPLEADRGQVGQVLLNMAVNAREAMPQGGTLTIRTARARPGTLPGGGEGIVFAVTDTGVGMDGAQQERVFEPFYTTKSRQGGSGLGLSICYGVVSAHHGTICIESQPGVGSSFEVTLPSSHKGVEGPTGEEQAPQGGSETVLVVEDEDQVRSLLCRTLRDLGYVTLEAGDGAEALRVIDRLAAPVDLVISDVTMPRMGGVELAERLRGHLPSSKILLMSGYADNLESGGDVALHKPFSMAALDEAVRCALRGAD
jgi:signal transduction histidine kinase/CheY-like chemotaxis protein